MPSAVAAPANNSIGTWKLNLAKTTVTPPLANPVTHLTMVNKAVEGGVEGTVTGQREDGTAIQFGGTIHYDGKPYPSTGAPWDTHSFTQIDANTFTFEDKSISGKYHAKGRQVISEDGRTMTITSEGINAEGTPVSAVQVFDRQ